MGSGPLGGFHLPGGLEQDVSEGTKLTWMPDLANSMQQVAKVVRVTGPVA